MRLFKSATLSIRLTKVITLLTFCLFVVFSLVTFFVAYSLEDVMFNQQLQQAKTQLQQHQPLPLNVKKLPDLSEFGLTLSPNKEFIEFDADDLFGEFSHQEKHFHYMKLTDGLLLMDVTEQVVVKRGAKDIFFILLLVFVFCILVSIFIAKAISSHALKPFHRLMMHFQQKNQSNTEPFASTANIDSDIEETDVKIIAEQLEQALAKQALLIEEQAAFNQGMSHEIRTPLQVMSHSMELMEANHSEVYQQPSMQRFVKSLARIKRISNALLWLTSIEKFQGRSCMTTILDKVLMDSKSLITAHKVDITLENIHHLKPEISIPEEVLELIFFNLINNAIHHGLQVNNSVLLKVTINKNKIIFCNEKANAKSEQQHFSLGLTLIEKLAKRFTIDFKTHITDNHFHAVFYFR